MSLALIQESAKEVRRLAIAGSPLAVGDFRLKKLIAPLEQAGAKVPVFAQVAKAISDLIHGKESESASNLLALSTLLNAILYTQGESTTGAELQLMEVYDAKISTTTTPARVLKPIIEALSKTGGGRFEVVKSAVERNAFNDLRLIEPSIRALEDTYPELADLIAEKVLPSYGPAIVPLLKQKLVLKGKRGDGRRLEVWHKVDPAGALETCKAALDDGSPEVKASAIACLGQHEECLPLVLEQATSKNKSLRAAALEALAVQDKPVVTQLFIDLIKGKSLELLAKPLRVFRNRQVLGALIDEGKRVLELLLKNETEQLQRFWEILDCLENRIELEVVQFLLSCNAQCEKLGKIKDAAKSPIAGMDIVERVTTLLYLVGTPDALEGVLTKREVLPLMAFPHVFRCAMRAWTSQKVYQEFAPLLAQKKGAGADKAEIIQSTILAAAWDFTSRFQPLGYVENDGSRAQELRATTWDPRWVDAAIKSDYTDIVCALAKPGHGSVVDYLLKVIPRKKDLQSGKVIAALARCQYPKVTDLFLHLVEGKTKKAHYLDYDLMFLFECARYLPPADLPKLEAFVAKLKDDFTISFLEAIQPLRPVAGHP